MLPLLPLSLQLPQYIHNIYNIRPLVPYPYLLFDLIKLTWILTIEHYALLHFPRALILPIDHFLKQNKQ